MIKANIDSLTLKMYVVNVKKKKNLKKRGFITVQQQTKQDKL